MCPVLWVVRSVRANCQEYADYSINIYSRLLVYSLDIHWFKAVFDGMVVTNAPHAESMQQTAASVHT